MPFVKISVTREGVTKEQKKRLIKGVTNLLVEVLDKNPKTTHIIIEEVELDNWGYDGEQTSEIRRRENK